MISAITKSLERTFASVSQKAKWKVIIRSVSWRVVAFPVSIRSAVLTSSETNGGEEFS